MVRKAVLLTMSPEGVRQQARRDGLNKSIRHQALGLNPGAVDRWFTGHPQYLDPQVKELLDEGARQHEERIANALAGLSTRRSFTVIATYPDGVRVEHYGLRGKEAR
jgi:hypothetical protein